MIDAWVQWIGAQFTPEQYVFWTRLECTVWTAADLAIVFYLLRIGDLARRMAGAGRHRVSYVVLYATILPALAVPLEPSGALIFLTELAVTLPHFAIILYVLIVDARFFRSALTRLLATTSAT